MPLIRASIELSYIASAPRSVSLACSTAGVARRTMIRASSTPAGAEITEAVSTWAAALGSTPFRMVA